MQPLPIAAVLVLSAVLPVNAASPLCREAADALKIGGPARPSLLDGLTQFVPSPVETDAIAAIAKWNVPDEIRAAVRDMTEDGHLFSRIFWLTPGEFGVVQTIGGTMECQSLLYFRIQNGTVSQIRPPAGITTDGCWTDTVLFGVDAGTPYAIEVDDSVGDRGSRITANAWSDGTWQQPCSLTETYSVTLDIANEYCRPGSDCTALKRIALAKADAAQAAHEQITPALWPPTGIPVPGPPPAPLALPKELPTFGAAPKDPYTTFSAPVAFDATFQDQAIVGAVGGGEIGWRPYWGWLVGFWKMNGNEYEPLAGFQVARHFGVVLSVDLLDVTVGNPSSHH